MEPFTLVRILCSFIHPRTSAPLGRPIGGQPRRRPAESAIECLLSALITFVLFARSTIALADDAWNVDADGVWEDPAVWFGGTPPDAIGARAYFGPVITVPRKVIVQDLPGIAGNSDSKVTVGEITINSGIPYSFAATTGLRPFQSIEVNNPGIAPTVVRTLSDFGHVTHFLGNSETGINSLDDLIVDTQAFGGLSLYLTNPVARRITKTGRGRVTVTSQTTGNVWDILEGTMAYPIFDSLGRPTTSSVIVENATLNPSRPSVTTGQGGSRMYLGAGASFQLEGQDVLNKLGPGSLTPSGVFSGPIDVHDGTLFLVGGTFRPLTGVPRVTLRDDGVYTHASVDIGSYDYRNTTIHIGKGAELFGPRENLGFGKLVRGQNLTLASGAVIVQRTELANSLFENLGSNADLYFGLGGLDQPRIDLQIGAGTPWRGLSGSIRSQSVNITANSDFGIQYFDQSYAIGDSSDGSAVTFKSTGERRVLTIARAVPGLTTPATAFSNPEVVFSAATTDFSGIGKLVLAQNAKARFSTGQIGTDATQIPIVDLHAGSHLETRGTLDNAVLNFLGSSTLTVSQQGDRSVGGKFVFSSRRPVTFRFASTPAARLGSIHVVDDSMISFSGSVNNTAIVEGATELNANAVALNGFVSFEGPIRGSGLIVSRGTVRVDGDLSEFKGPNSRIAVKSGVLTIGTTDLDLGPEGPQVDLQTNESGQQGMLSLIHDVDVSHKIAPESTGILALGILNTTLRGVNQSRAWIGADKIGSLLLTPQLEPGAENTYRFRGGSGSNIATTIGSASTPNQLTGPNNLLTGPGFVEIRSSNNYTGTTTIGGTLVLAAPQSIGNNVAASDVHINGTLLIDTTGTLGPTGPLHVNGRLSLMLPGESSDQLPDDTPIFLNSEIHVQNASLLSSATESVGALTVSSGTRRIRLQSSAFQNVRLNMGHLDRETGGMLAIDSLSARREVHIENGEQLVVNGIIPWLIPNDGYDAFVATYSANGVTKYEGPYITDINAAAATDNVRLSTTAALTSNTVINSVGGGNVDLQGHILSVGAIKSDGRAIGRVFGTRIGLPQNPGFLTSGQTAFVPNAAAPAELIVNSTIESVTIDNAGRDGVFDNNDDYPVTIVMLAGSLNNRANRHTGGTTILGTVSAHADALPGITTLRSGTLRLVPDLVESQFGTAAIVASSQNFEPVTLAASLVSDGGNTLRVPVHIASLTVMPQTTLTLANSTSAQQRRPIFVVDDLLDLRGAVLSSNDPNDDRPLMVRGEYKDDTKTLLVANNFPQRIDFRTGATVDVMATSRRIGFNVEGANTTMRFSGRLDTTPQTVIARSQLRAAGGGKILVLPEATLAGGLLELAGDPHGSIEFAAGHSLIKSVADIKTDFVGIDSLRIVEPIRLITNDSANLPNFTADYMSHEAPGVYRGSIVITADGAVWQTQTAPHQFNQRFDLAAAAELVTNSSLTLTADSLLALGAGRGSLVQGINAAALLKRGAADFRIDGRIALLQDSILDIREGRLVMNNSTAEGTGKLYVDIHSGATLAGGNADGTRGLIPGVVTVKAGGVLAPGDRSSHGILNVIGDHGALALEPNAIFQPSIGGDQPGTLHDFVRSIGEVTLGRIGGNPILDPQLAYTPEIGDLLFLIDNDLAEPTTGLFRRLDGGVLDHGGFIDVLSSADNTAHRFLVSYTADTATRQFAGVGNDVALLAVPIPEPSTCVLLILAATLLLTARQRLRR